MWINILTKKLRPFIVTHWDAAKRYPLTKVVIYKDKLCLLIII